MPLACEVTIAPLVSALAVPSVVTVVLLILIEAGLI